MALEAINRMMASFGHLRTMAVLKAFADAAVLLERVLRQTKLMSNPPVRCVCCGAARPHAHRGQRFP